MKKKRFYNNKKRNSKWTEPEKGRKIDFADKYIEAGTGSDKFDKKRPKRKKKRFTAEKTNKLIKGVLTVIFSFAVISVGYGVMDLYMDRNSMPETDFSQSDTASLGSLSLNVQSVGVPSLSLDGSVMLDAVISDVQKLGYSSVTFDLKRDDGTVGYESSLATIEAYGAVSSAAVDLKSSVSRLLESDLLPIARISCYKDNIATSADLTAAVTKGTSVYKDAENNAYLNPDSAVTYNYIKGIIEEAKAMGVTVFALDNTRLPDEISNGYNDGFTVLSKKLYADFGDSIKLLNVNTVEAIDDSIVEESTYADGEAVVNEEASGYEKAATQSDYNQLSDADAFEKLLEEKIMGSAGANSVYYIKTNNVDAVRKYLDSKNISNYIIIEEK